MSDTSSENTTPHGFLITTETIAKGAIRIKTKIWLDHLELDKGIEKAVYLYEKTLTEFRNKGIKIDGDV